MSNSVRPDGLPSDPRELTFARDVRDEDHSGVRKVSRRLNPLNVGLSLLAGLLSMACYAAFAPISARAFGISLGWQIEVPVIFLLYTTTAALTYLAVHRRSQPP